MLNRWSTLGLIVLLALALFQGATKQAMADPLDRSWVSKVISLQGNVMVNRQGETHWEPARLNDTLNAGDRLNVEANSRAGIVLSNDAVLRLDQHTTLVFTEIEKETSFIFKLLKGAANFFSRRPRSLKVVTPFVNGVVEGTEFLVQVDDHQTRIDLFEGRILAENPHGELQLIKGQGAVATADTAPQRRILVKPRDSVQWALYYPPVMALGLEEAPEEYKDSIALFNQGRSHKALYRLEQIGPQDQDSMFFVYRAALLLHLGRVAKALDDIQHAMEIDPDNGEALALKAVIDVVQNQKEEALATAQEAVKRKPSSAATQMSLSYAHQAGFNLTEALQAAEAAVTHAPENGMAWARLAELLLSTGKLDHGIRAAQKAVKFNPQAAHAYTTLGFAYLTQIKIKKGRAAFERAITLDSATPLPRLGLGLAKIRKGQLKEGRREIEIAAGLDPVNALIRSYLGKAYFEERREPLDEKQLEIAKTLDPNDPTPWFYDAIRKQTLNRSVEALHDLEKSIELNDNRAVYRSRMLLDEDLAARSASLGRIYNDLDFQHLALIEGYNSLNADSTNYSAHKLLADNYAIKPRHEVARVSELLQAQLFQPLNLTPLQAHLAETDTQFFQGSGPDELAFNEYNPLFMRNRAAFQGNWIKASDQTYGNEFAVSGILNRFSCSLGVLNYQTDGFRKNNDYQQDIYNLFLQGRMTHDTSLQAEYRYSESESGDLSRNFDSLFSEEQRDEKDIEKIRLGAHHRFTSDFEMVASYINADENFDQVSVYDGFPGAVESHYEGDLYEARVDYDKKRFGIIGGISIMDGKLYEKAQIEMFGFDVVLLDEKAEINREKAFVYSNLNFADMANITIGLSAVSMEYGSQIESEQLNPKLALTLRSSVGTTIRLAGFRVLSNTLSNTSMFTQTIEPTQVGGFNQLYDDLDASDIKTYGIAVDQKFAKRLFGGIEYILRDLDVPWFQIDSDVRARFYDWKEEAGLIYVNWAPMDVLVLRAECQYEHFDYEEPTIRYNIVDVDTWRIPLSMSYFSPLGFSFKVVATYIMQEGDFLTTDTEEEFSDDDNFWIFDAEFSYRLPKRTGALSVGVKNLFDEEFNYADTDPSNPAVVPELFAYGKITLSF